jgi:signal transduction histidine kinase
MVSHELRNPLTSIKGFASTLLAEDVTWDKATQDEFIRLIDEEADKLADLVGQLLDLSRMETGNFSIQPLPTTPHKIVEAALPQLSLITSKHQLHIDLPEALPPVEADTQRIAQVLNNLVGNAAKFSPPGTTIYVEVSARDRGVQFDVTDQGVGIAPEDRVRIFEAFRQGQHQPGEITKGAGLGLAIARGLVEAHRGRIWIQERAGPGTTFSFLLPAQFHSSQD